MVDSRSGKANKEPHAGGFGLVIGVNRGDHAAALRQHGADVVVDDLGEVAVVARCN